MAWIAPVAIAAGSAIGGGIMNAQSQAGANAMSEKIAQQEMDWQTQMSNTAEQRHVADLRAAGLNPALAYGTPAPVPGSAPLPNIQATNPGSGIIQGGTAAAQALMQSKFQAAQIDATSAQADKTRAETAAVVATNPFAGSSAKANLDNMLSTQRLLNQQVQNAGEDFWNTLEQMRGRQLSNNLQSQLNPIIESIQRLDFQRQQLGMSKIQNEAAAQSSWWMRKVAPYLPGGTAALDSGVNAAGKLPAVIDWMAKP